MHGCSAVSLPSRACLRLLRGHPCVPNVVVHCALRARLGGLCKEGCMREPRLFSRLFLSAGGRYLGCQKALKTQLSRRSTYAAHGLHDAD